MKTCSTGMCHGPRPGIVLVALLALAVRIVAAEPINLRHDELTLNGEFMRASATTEERTVLVLHGTLANHGMELIATLQSLLLERGVTSLAITLSLGIDNRTGRYDCDGPHRHRHLDALDELEAWMRWLDAQGISDITLLGHSRGANQVARYALDRTRVAAKRVVVVAPMTWSAQGQAARFRDRHDESLETLLGRARASDGATEIEAPFLYCDPGKVPAATFLSYYDDDRAFDTPNLLADIPLPVLAVAGSADTTVPGIAARLTALQGAHLTTLVVEDADHFFLDFYAEDLADAVAEFITAPAP